MNLPYPVVLASASPRRQDLLRELVPDFEVISADVDESALTGESPSELALRLASEKAEAVLAVRPRSLIIAGDTVVALPTEILGKPVDADDALRMLRALSGQTHEVLTGIAVYWPGHRESFVEATRVTFGDLSDEQIADYVATGEPMDKAGAYAIQCGAAEFVTTMEGSLTNVIGLPMERLAEVLRSWFP